METFRIEQLSFSYPEQSACALSDISLTIQRGAFWVLCGPSGCGQSTLLRHLKPTLAPHGCGRATFSLKANRWSLWITAPRVNA